MPTTSKSSSKSTPLSIAFPTAAIQSSYGQIIAPLFAKSAQESSGLSIGSNSKSSSRSKIDKPLTPFLSPRSYISSTAPRSLSNATTKDSFFLYFTPSSRATLSIISEPRTFIFAFIEPTFASNPA